MSNPFVRSRTTSTISFSASLDVPISSAAADDCAILYVQGEAPAGDNSGVPALPNWFTLVEQASDSTGFKLIAYGRVPAGGGNSLIKLQAGAGQTVSGGWWGWCDVIGRVGWKTNGWLDVPVTAANFGSYTRADVSAPTTFSMRVKVALVTDGVSQTFVGWNTGDAGIGLNASNRPIVFIKNTLGNSIGNVAANAPIPGLSVGAAVWIRGDITISTGSISYYYSYDPGAHASSVAIHWTQLGTAVAGTNGGTTPRVSNSDTVLFGVGTAVKIYSFVEQLVAGTNSLEVNFSDPLPGALTLTGSDIRHHRPTADNLPGAVPFEYYRSCLSGTCFTDPSQIYIPSMSVYGDDRLAYITWLGESSTSGAASPLDGPADWKPYADRSLRSLAVRFKSVTRTKVVDTSFTNLDVELNPASTFTWFYFEAVFTPLAAVEMPPRSPQPPQLKLGCADSYGVFITDGTYETVIDQVHWSEISWERVLDDISQARAVLPDDHGGVYCVAHLGGLLPLAYGLAIERNDRLVWRGPITTVGRQGHNIIVGAADTFMRYQKRFLLRNRFPRVDFDGDAASLFRDIIVGHAAQPTDRWHLPVPDVVSGVTVRRALKPREFKMAWDLMSQLLQSALDAYIMNGVLYLWDPNEGWRYRVVPTRASSFTASQNKTLDGPYNLNRDLVYGVFSEESFSTRPDWTLDGPGCANFIVVPAPDSGQEGFRAYEYAESISSQEFFGVLDSVETNPPELPEDAAPSEISATSLARAQSSVALRAFPPMSVEGGALSEQAPIDVDHLRPGSLWKIDVFDDGFGELLTVGRLRRVSVSVRRTDKGLAESVVPTLEPPGQEGAF